MKLFLLEDVETDARYCATDATLACGADISEGLPATPDIQRLGLGVLELPMDEDRGGLELPDYVSNSDNMLILRRACADAIVTHSSVGNHELLPAKLINQKGRLHSDDYAILNPLGKSDCVDRQNSDMDKTPDAWVNPWGKWYLRRALVPTDRDLFRVVGVVGYFFSETLVSFVQAQGFTNFRFKPVLLS